jgi:hypothetical protein
VTAPDETQELRAPATRTGALEPRTPREASGQAESGPSGPATAALAAQNGGGGPDDALPEPRRRRRKGRTALIVVIAIAVAAAAGVAATGVLGGDSDTNEATAPSGPPATVEVQQTSLTRTEIVSGYLGYGDEEIVTAPSGSGGSEGDSSATDPSAGQPEPGTDGDSGDASGTGAGIITWVAPDGQTIKRGEVVYSVDEQDVPLLYGDIPLYRTLEEGLEGDDVEMLERNLYELGYTDITVDQEYTSATADAVEEWQEDLGRDATGIVETGDAVVAPDARRVAESLVTPGMVLSGDLLSWTGNERLITVDLDVQLEDLVAEGTTATITLPDDTTVEAEVTDIGTPTTPEGEGGESGAEESSEEATLPVELTVADQEGLGNYQAAEVSVTLEAETREDVLVVPVNALVARPGGGYAVEAVTNNGTEYVPVEVGMFSDGLVEISGDGVSAGMVVGVPE